MFSKADISKLANAKSYERGEVIARMPSDITSRKLDYLEDATEIKAHVKSASGVSEFFRSTVICDPDLESIIDYECTCPAAMRFDTMCKHCIALSLTFLKDPRSFAGYRADRTPKTSRSITNFIQKNPLPLQTTADAEGVSIEVELRYTFGKWDARFKCKGASGTYVIPNLREFAEAVKQNRVITYGKRLSFRHSIDAFDAVSQDIANLIVGAIDIRHALDASGRSRMSTAISGRDLTLTESEVVDLLNALKDRSFRFENASTSSKLFNVSVIDADPPIRIRFLEEGSDGFLIMRDDEFVSVSSGKGAFVFIDDAVYRCSQKIMQITPFLESVYLSDDDELFLSKTDAPLFAANVLPALEDSLDVSVPDSLEKLKPIPGSIGYYFDLMRVGKREIITVEVRAKYAEHEYILGEDTLPAEVSTSPQETTPTVVPLRDEGLENAAIAALSDIFDLSFQLPLENEEKIGALLFGGLEALQNFGAVYTTDAFNKLLTTRSPRVQIGLSIEGNLLNMDVQPTDMDDDELVALLKSYKRKKHFHRLKSGAFLSLQDMELKEFSKMVEDLGLTPEEVASGSLNIPAYRAFLIDREYSDIVREESFRSYIECFDNIDPDSFDPPRSLMKTMRPYQIDGFKWLSTLHELGFGGILADEMGLGKTLQVISLLLSLLEQGKLAKPALIVCPASLVYNWNDEIERFAPALKARPVEGSKIERNRIRKDGQTNIFIASYDIVRIDAEAFKAMDLSYIILDEAQFIKNHATKTTRAIKQLSADHRLALTGTPIENRLSEIWSIFDFLMPGFLGTYAYFMQRYENEILGGDEECANRLQALVGPFILRRLKSAVLTELPDKMESVIHVPMTEEQERLYNANEQDLRQSLNIQKKTSASRAMRKRGTVQDRGIGKIEVLAELTRLRQIALDPSLVYEGYTGGASKVSAIMGLVEQAMDTGRKTLVFSQFTSYLDILKAELAERDIPFYVITGSTPKQERLDLVNAFNSNDVPVFLVSLKAGGTGLNLTGASVVIHADPWWNAAAVNQATDRAHRIGQNKHVNVYKIISKNTIEERIEFLQEKKTELADSIVKQVDAISLKNLTKDDLEFLLSD